MERSYREFVEAGNGRSRGVSDAGKHILFIDDDLDMHDIVRLILEPLGYRITCCATAPAGREALRRDRPDLILLDIMLASPDEGIVLAKELKSDGDLKEIPIVIISSMGESVGADYARELDAGGLPREGFLEKPLDALKLRSVLSRLLERGS
jgi:CheY-like chemotaxis protein